MPVAELNGVQVYYEVHGEGEPLLLIAGLGSDSQSWGPVVGDLAASFQVIVADNRGVGRTAQDVEITIEAMARDSVALLDHLAIPSAHVLGHSMGGIIALEMGLSYPGRVRKLVLAGTSSVLPVGERELLKEWDRRFGVDDHAQWLEYIFQWIFTRRYLDDPKLLAATIKYSVEYPYQQTKQALHRQTGALLAFDRSAEVPQLAAPALVLSGEEDILITPAQSEASLGSIPNVSFLRLPGAAHAMHLENRADFVAGVRDFLRG